MRKILNLFVMTLMSLGFSLRVMASPQVLNLGPAFKAYIDENRNASWDQRWTNWKIFEAKYSSYFSAGLCEPDSAGCEEKKQGGLKNLFAALPKLEPKLWNTFQQLNDIALTQSKVFQKEFADLRSDSLVVVMPSLLGFNGRVATIGEKHVLLLAPDSLLYRNDDINVVFLHENFHVYQFDSIDENKIFKTMASPLWFEGFATWVSILLSPGTTDSIALMDDSLAAYCSSNDHIRFLANEYLSILNMKNDDPDIDVTYQKWFLLSGNTDLGRRGYCIGLQVIREVTRSIPFHELINLDESQFTPLIAKALKTLSKNDKNFFNPKEASCKL